MKTPAEWNLIFTTTQTPTFDLISQVQSDARAGMVPEGDLGPLLVWPGSMVPTVDGERKVTEAECAFYDLGRAHQHRRQEEEHEAELAKAWEAGRDAAAELVGNHCCVSTCCDAQPSAGEAKDLARCIRQLQPPGGKAK